MLQQRLYKLLFFSALAVCIIPAGCKKENKNAPVIMQIRAITPAPNDSVLTLAGPGQTVVIQGSYFSTTQQVYFNGYLSPFNSALLSDDNIVITIPADMPFASLDPNDLNTIRVITAYGEILYNFPIVPPPPVIMTASNEYAVAGERIILTGNNFFFVDKVVFPGGVEVTSNIVTNDPGTRLEVTVPPGISTGGHIQVVNQFGTGTSLLYFNDFTTGLLCNFDNVNTNNNWAGATITNDPTDYPNNTGNYARFMFTDIPANDFVWYGGGRSLNVEANLPWVPVADLNLPLDNYALKFEVNVKDSWTGGSLFFLKDYSWNYVARYEPWKAGGEFTTSGWQTVVIPLSTFKTKANNMDGTGDPASSLTALLGGSGSGGINVFVINAENSVLSSIDIAVDNFRVIKYQN